MSTTAGQGEEDVVVTATEPAAEQARELMDGEGMDAGEAGLRLYVQQGGCAGLSYGMRFENEPEPEDEIFESNGIRLFVDQSSLNYVGGSQLAYEGGLQGAGFHVQNPNVESECGCGESFRT
ncbi:HesB/IscA family protein [Halobacterium wangiae]|uniref:HesB/IscA family protein n=1 Tax=Halobacterium wangiae TaxID=2902623 RepID=UPI001E3950BE|nr:iron-sulfur cluster assembly accessory protein [Halobacterium wangiae]